MACTFKLGGAAGSGIFTIGSSLAKVLKHSGMNVYTCKDYPSLIKGGHNLFMIHTCEDKIYSNIKRLDFLVAIDKLTVTKHKDEIKDCKALIYNSDAVKDLDIDAGNTHIIPVPFTSIAEKIGNRIYANTVAFGAVCGIVKADVGLAKKILEKVFRRKGDKVVQDNIESFQQGYDATEKYAEKIGILISKNHDENRILINGNQALAYGAIKAGCKFQASYPMTPATSIMQTLAANEIEYNIVLKQTEDEIAAINTAIGASFAGVRSMVATSGGGFALMSEALGMAGNAEVPLVVAEVQRGGESTGIPTYTGQGDLRFVQHASQGEFPRIVLAPGDPEECFYDGFNAFNLAEIYQTPVLIISDKELATMDVTIPKFDMNDMKVNRGKLLKADEVKEGYKRHELTEDGISPRCLPGHPNGMHIASSYEHDETGYTSEDADVRVKQADKRFRKLAHLYDRNKAVYRYGDDSPDIQLVVWGSTKGACLEAMKTFKELSIKVRIIQVRMICPFPSKQFEKAYDPKIPSLMLEHNKTGQLRGIIRENTGIFIENFYGKYDGRPMYPEDIVEQVRKVLI